MGSFAFGKERRAVNAVTHMERVQPFFLVSKWGDDSVPRLLAQYHLSFAKTSFGYLGYQRPDWAAINLLHSPRLQYTVVRTYTRHQCRTILVLGLRDFLNALPALLYLKLCKGARFVFYLGDIPGDTFVYRRLTRLAGRLGSAVIVNSDAVKRGLLAHGLAERQVKVIYNGVELERFQNAQPLEIRAERRWDSDDVIVGYVGQFSENKGVEDFVRAAELVLRKDVRCRFVMTGPLDRENRCLQELREYIVRQGLDDHFAFPGRIEQVERIYAALDIVVVPSRHEDPAPNVNLEAMASGIPVIGTRTGGTPELLADGETGFLVTPENPAEIAERIVQLANDPILRETMGKAGIERVRQKFDVRANARLIESVLLNS